jgi:glycosyltransferase involved in cell wall biosynthesis
LSTPPHVAFVFEQTLGHVTHAANLRAVIAEDDRIAASWCPIEYEMQPISGRLPGWRNWTVRAGVRARRAVRAANRARPLDALFIHTQVPAVLIPDWLKRVPSVVSIDATPVQYDLFGAFYAHEPGNARIERLKWRANKQCFDRAKAMVSWSAWSKASLVDDYGVSPEKINVIPPGVWLDTWTRRGAEADDDVVRILFVGADFERKGGETLLRSFRMLRTRPAVGGASPVELHIVTKSPIAAEEAVFVYRDLGPNDPRLLELYHRCDVFCLPTRADMLALVLVEAAATGLPLVATALGGIPEIVEDGETGLLVPPDDPDALSAALGRLVDDPELRRGIGSRAAAVARERFDAEKNAAKLVELILSVAQGR